MRFQWEIKKNASPDHLADTAYLHVDRKPPRVGILPDRTEEAKRFEEALEAVPGVTDVSSWGYQIRVEKGRIFAWDEVTPAVIEVVGRFFGEPMVESREPSARSSS